MTPLIFMRSCVLARQITRQSQRVSLVSRLQSSVTMTIPQDGGIFDHLCSDIIHLPFVIQKHQHGLRASYHINVLLIDNHNSF